MKKKPSKKVVHSRALVLVAVLWIIALLTAMLAVAGKAARIDTRVCQAWAERIRGQWACRAGLEKAIAMLNDDLKISDCLTDQWHDNPVECENIKLGQSVFFFEIVDEASKLNINTATKKQLMQLAGMTEEIAGAIIDWRDEDNNTGAEGAEAEHYLNLHPGYAIRNGPFRTIRELLLVKGVTFDLLYGEDTNLNGQLDYNENDGEETFPADNADDILDQGWFAYLSCYSYDRNVDGMGNDRININKADQSKLTESLKIKKSYAKWIVENRKEGFKSIADLIDNDSPDEPDEKESDKAQKIDKQTFDRIAEKITVKGEKRIPGRVNINTASRTVLSALLDNNEQLADNIIAYRAGLVDGMISIAEILKVKSMNLETFKKIAEQITTRSNVFSVNCSAESGLTRTVSRLETVVDRNQSPAGILYWYQGVNN